ncbi:MAG: hypothetical protein J7J06_04735 [Methanosarcinales archaeon]|nr:hypothetical protein [Methanosarcinales archaeon]
MMDTKKVHLPVIMEKDEDGFFVVECPILQGSYIRMWHEFDKSKKPLTIPKHKVLGKGLLRKLVRDAEISVEEFNRLL